MKNNISKQAFKSYGQNFAHKTATVSFLGLVVILALFLAYLIPVSLFISVPLIIIPVLFSFISENAANGKYGDKPTTIFAFIPIYFTNLFFGGFKLIHGFIKSFIVYLITSSFISIILVLTIGLNDPSFVEILNNSTNLTEIANINKMMEQLNQNQTFILISNISEISSFGVASYMFIHHVFTHSFKMYFNIFAKMPMPMKGINKLHAYAFRSIRRKFYKDYYSAIWFMAALFISGYAIGAIFSYLYLNLNFAQTEIIGLFTGMVLNLFFIPYFYDVLLLIHKKYSPNYRIAFIELSKKSLDELAKQKSITEENEKELKDILKDFESSLDKKDEDKKEDK